MPVNYPNLFTEIDAEIARLMQVRKLLLTGASIQTRGRKRKLSAAAQARISAAQKKRWRERRRAAK